MCFKYAKGIFCLRTDEVDWPEMWRRKSCSSSRRNSFGKKKFKALDYEA